jgi:hypothetical protein
MTEHTKGPWHITSWGSVDAKDRQIALVQNGGVIDMGNARLIAAAPDLLAALVELASVGAEAWGDNRPCIREARAAIAKATE